MPNAIKERRVAWYTARVSVRIIMKKKISKDIALWINQSVWNCSKWEKKYEICHRLLFVSVKTVAIVGSDAEKDTDAEFRRLEGLEGECHAKYVRINRTATVWWWYWLNECLAKNRVAKIGSVWCVWDENARNDWWNKPIRCWRSVRHALSFE